MIYPGKDIEEIMRDVVLATQTSILPVLQKANSTIKSIRYEYGHPKEIIQTLAERCKDMGTIENNFVDAGKDDMWPLVMLFTDIGEEFGSRFTYPNVSLHMVLAMITDPQLKAADRDEKNFKPILTPLYRELIKQMDRSIYLKTQSAAQIKHSALKRRYWGKEGVMGTTGNQFNDYIDAIELQNVQLSLYH